MNTVRFDLEVARRQLSRVKEEKLSQMERIVVVQKIAKIEDELKVKWQSLSLLIHYIDIFKGIPAIDVREQEINIGKQSLVPSYL